jgi:type III secretory pathway component EscV
MAHTFGELVVGGVLVAPFVTYLVATLAVLIVLRPLLNVAGFAKMFSHPAIAQLSLFVTILCLLMLMF